MTTIEVNLPDDLAREAREAGLLTPDRIEAILREQLRRRTLREFFAALDRADSIDNSPAMSPEDVAVVLAEMREEKRAATAR